MSRKPISDDTFFQTIATARMLVESEPELNINAAILAASIMQLNDSQAGTNDCLQDMKFELTQFFQR